MILEPDHNSYLYFRSILLIVGGIAMVEGRPFGDSESEDDSSEASMTRRRKIEHIEICLDEEVQCQRSTMFEDMGNAFVAEMCSKGMELSTTEAFLA